MSSIKMTVIVPLFNVEKHIAECIDSILFQTLKDIEIICIDDGSVDETVQIITTYMKRFNNIQLIKQKHAGAGVARNKGIEAAKGEFLAFIDADDFYPNNQVLEILFVKAKENHVVLCGGGLDHIFNDSTIGKDPHGFNQKYKKEGKYKYCDVGFEPGWVRFIYNRKFLKCNNLKLKNHIVGEDSLFKLEVFAVAEEFYYVPQVIYMYRVGERKLRRKVDNIICLLSMIRDALDISNYYKLDKQHAYFIRIFQQDNYTPICYALENGQKEIIQLVNDIYNHMNLDLIHDLDCEIIPELYHESERKKFIQLCHLRWEAILNSQINYEKIIIYGAGRVGRELLLYLKKHSYKQKLIVAVTKKENCNIKIDDIELNEITELTQYRDNSIILIATMEKAQMEIMGLLKELNFNNIIPINQKIIGMWNLLHQDNL